MIDINDKELEKITKELEGIDNGVEKVLSRAINKAASETKKEAVNKITEEFYIKKKAVNPSIRISRARENKLTAEISNNRKRDRFTLKRFKVEVPSTGPIKVAQSKSGGLKELKRAFLAAPKTQPGNIHVLRRDGKNRYPLDVQRGYSTGGMLSVTSVDEYLEERAQEKLDREIPRELEKFFEGEK